MYSHQMIAFVFRSSLNKQMRFSSAIPFFVKVGLSLDRAIDNPQPVKMLVNRRLRLVPNPTKSESFPL